MIRRLWCLALLAALATHLANSSTASAQEKPPAGQLPAELRGAKIYQLPEETKPGEAMENPVVYKNLAYDEINFEHLALKLFLSVEPVDRAATVRRIYFQDIRVNKVPVHIETFDSEFKVSKKDVVDLPAPLKCAIVFSDLDSLAPVKEIIEQDKIRITGQSFIEVKLTTAEKLALRTKQLVIPVNLNEEVPLNMFAGNPLLQMAAVRVLDTLSDPRTAAGLKLAKEHLAKVSEEETLASAARLGLYLLYCEYAFQDPKTMATERFSQTGTGFILSEDGKLLTTKRLVQPWKFDPQIAFLVSRYHLEPLARDYRLFAWPVDAPLLGPDGRLNYPAAFGTDNQSLKILKTTPDQMQKQDYQDPDSGERASLSIHEGGESDVALLQLAGTGFKPLAVADATAKVGPALKTALFGFPFGLSQAQVNPQLMFVKATPEGSLISLERPLNPGESGAPLLTPEGKVVALADSANQCIPIEVARMLTQ
jgi:hypothetical protein